MHRSLSIKIVTRLAKRGDRGEIHDPFDCLTDLKDSFSIGFTSRQTLNRLVQML